MAGTFKRTRRGIEAMFDGNEAEVCTHFLLELHAMLGEPETAAAPTPEWARELGLAGLGDEAVVRPPDDPALARLLPDGTRGDDELATDFRRLTEAGIRAVKRAAIITAVGCFQRSGEGGPSSPSRRRRPCSGL